MPIRIKARSGESVQQMMRRFKKLCEKEGLTKDVARKAYYEAALKRRQIKAGKIVRVRIRAGAVLDNVLAGGPGSSTADRYGSPSAMAAGQVRQAKVGERKGTEAREQQFWEQLTTQLSASVDHATAARVQLHAAVDSVKKSADRLADLGGSR